MCSYNVHGGLGVNDMVTMLSRSKDGGQTWTHQGAVWPQLKGEFSTFCNISRSALGELFLLGAQIPIDEPGESWWSQESLGVKQNELIYSRSSDDGHSWSTPETIAMPSPGSAETPAPLCVTRSGRWLAPYAPHPTFDLDLEVNRRNIVLLISDDQGKSWQHTSMIRVRQENSIVGESWVAELADGRLLETAWHARLGEGNDFPNVFALSVDGGQTWQPTQAKTIMGQSTAIAALPDGRVLFVYNQRLHDVPGVWLAVANPTNEDFGISANQIVWKAEKSTLGNSSGKHEQWSDFAFGEPSIIPLPDKTLLVTLRCDQPNGTGVPYVKLRMNDA